MLRPTEVLMLQHAVYVGVQAQIPRYQIAKQPMVPAQVVLQVILPD